MVDRTVALFFCCVFTWSCLGAGAGALVCEGKCDAFKPVCASYEGEHQFFYSHCDMLRTNCLTGANWKRDFFSHCNINK